jgi:hypothetical protein
MRNIDDPYEARYHVEIPEKVCIDLNVPEELGKEVTSK